MEPKAPLVEGKVYMRRDAKPLTSDSPRYFDRTLLQPVDGCGNSETVSQNGCSSVAAKHWNRSVINTAQIAEFAFPGLSLS